MELGIKEAVKKLRNGGVVVFPTDTVWGVGAAVSSEKGLEKLYRVKKRDKNKPTAILVSNMHMAEKYGVFSEKVWNMGVRYWPGAVTLVVPEREGVVPELVSGGTGKVGLRIPKHDGVVKMIDELGEGLVASSANVAGEEAPRLRGEICNQVLRAVDGVVEGEAGEGVSSTVIDTTRRSLEVLREGSVLLN